ncbi:hypothetical protein K2224_21660 [Streptomyces sp. BHT-5-2]|uniref:LamG-like jellyroll fold domain-containing protein n=1 Tax=Streptomyces sp. BHT-5-2 TaxID=2866715 RepID=UPI001C8DBD4D|nr:LamG-like jellyroll fold domain-containing protein [Streptomyces sp. BHT-5-2]QZL05425.1 hypothetical protein K2224_21660 [Streptomyces sp. BHT-5-2]
MTSTSPVGTPSGPRNATAGIDDLTGRPEGVPGRRGAAPNAGGRPAGSDRGDGAGGGCGSAGSGRSAVHRRVRVVGPAGRRRHGAGDGAARRLHLYVNGTQQGAATDTRPVTRPGSLMIGRATFGGRPVDFFSGSIERVQVFDQALPAKQVAALEPGLQG